MRTEYLLWIRPFSQALQIYTGIYTPQYPADVDSTQYFIQLNHLRLHKANESFKNIQVVMGVWFRFREEPE